MEPEQSTGDKHGTGGATQARGVGGEPERAVLWRVMSLGVALAVIVFASGAMAVLVLKVQQMAEAHKPLPVIGQVSDFALKDRSGRTVSLKDISGHPWVAGFIFTRCTGPCPRISAEMRDLQRDLPPRFRLVSFSVDPEYDTPDVLAAYADLFGADRDRWLFLTGKKPDMYAFIVGSFKVSVLEVFEESDRIITHSTRLVLVDPTARIRGYYESTDPDDMKKLRADARRM
jgi:cytochrome oxidase Cu insertion factor (SCO1/SenC/PrrC family)